MGNRIIYRFKHLDEGERINKPVFNKVILFSNAYFVIEAITSVYYSVQTWDKAQWIDLKPRQKAVPIIVRSKGAW